MYTIEHEIHGKYKSYVQNTESIEFESHANYLFFNPVMV